MYSEGNPGLKPQYTHTLNFGYTYEKFNISLVTQRATQVITQETFVNTTEMGYPTAITWGNFGKSNFTGVTTSLSNVFVGTWWSFNLYASGFYTESITQDYEDSRFYATAYMENTFYIGRTWRAEIMGSAQSPLSYGYNTISGHYFVSAGIRKNLWNYKATIALYVDDIFDSQKVRVLTDREGQRIEMNSKWSSRQIRLSFSYRFRDMKLRKTSELEEVNRVGQ